MKGDIMIYTVKRIEEDVDYGCEERPEDVPVMAVVTLTNSLGEELVIKAEDAMLYECNINEGDKVSIAIVKVGASGSYIRKGTEEIKVSAIPVGKVIDTTGAGDYFAAGFLYGLTCGYSLEKCAKIGSILSGNVIQVIGTTIPEERWDEIKLNINRILAE